MIGHGCRTHLWAALLLLGLAHLAPAQTPAASGTPAAPGAVVDNPLQIPDLRGIVPTATTREGISATLQIMIIMTVLTLAPSILVMTTSFTRILVVLALLRQALGTQQLPPGQIMVGLALFMTLMIMGPTYQKIYSEAITPWLDNAPGMTQQKAFDVAMGHMRDFMFNQIERTGNEEDVFLFLEYTEKRQIPAGEKLTRAQVPSTVVIPAFILSELKTAFLIGFRIYLPFLVIDMVIATVLISMGMLMLPPVLVSLPFKLLLFVLADGWRLMAASLLAGFA